MINNRPAAGFRFFPHSVSYFSPLVIIPRSRFRCATNRRKNVVSPLWIIDAFVMEARKYSASCLSCTALSYFYFPLLFVFFSFSFALQADRDNVSALIELPADSPSECSTRTCVRDEVIARQGEERLDYVSIRLAGKIDHRQGVMA